MIKTEAYFIPHCDNETCDLGAFQYTCPNCGKTFSDYEIWWKEDDIWNGDVVNFKCEDCSKDLIVYKNKDGYEYFVEQIN